MARVRFSGHAEADLYEVGLYTLRTWGEAQAERYVSQLERSCQLLAGNRALGRACDEIRPGLRRMEQGKHVLFYREEAGGIRIIRILHQRMLPENQEIDDTELR